MKKLSMGLLAISAMVLAMALGWPVPAAAKAGDDQRVAVVNGSAITQGDMDREMVAVQRRVSGAGQTLDPARLQNMKKDVLEGLINRELLYQESKKRGIKADSAVVNEQLQSVKKRFPDEKGFESALASSGLSPESFRSLIERELAIQQLVDREIVQKVTVTDQETKTYYETHPEAFKQPAQIKASHILIKVDPQAKESQKAEAKKKILDIRKKIQAGGDFEALAKEHSDCPSRAKGGDLGYFGRGQMVGPFEAAAFALKPGELSDVVETQFGFHLIKVTDTKPEGPIAFQDVKDRLHQHLKQEKVQKDLTAYVEGLKGKAKVERLLKDKTD